MRYCEVEQLVVTRRKYRGHWMYLDAEGERITDRDEIDRLNAIGLPPAYTDARFAADPEAHIQATGIDARGRKQYVYHADYVTQRDARKFSACVGFGHRLPKIRQRVEADLAKRGLSRERAVASIVRLLDSGRIRIGNESYAQANGSFGATTLRRRHARLNGRKLALSFRAKSGKQCKFQVSDSGLIRFVKSMQDLPGQHLFQYKGDDDAFHPVSSTDVNAYVHDIMGEDYTAKDFRTWRASVLAFEWLREAEKGASLRDLLDHVSRHLGNTPAVARKSYIHPALIEVARKGAAADFPRKLPRATKWLTAAERGLMDFLEQSGC